MARAVLRLAALSVAFATMGGAIGYLLLPERAPEAAGLPQVRVRGRRVGPVRDPHAVALQIARAFLRERVTVRADGHSIERTREAFGARVDVALLTRLLASATDPSSALLRHHAAITHGPVELPMPVRLEGAIALPLLAQLKEEVDRSPVDARIDVERRRVVPERREALAAFAEGRKPQYRGV